MEDVDKQTIGLQLLGFSVSLHFGSKYVCAVLNQSWKLSGCSIAWSHAFSRSCFRAVSCLSQKLGTASWPGDFKLLVFLNEACNSTYVMSSQGLHSVLACCNCSLFIRYAEWLCSLSFSKMLRQNDYVASFFDGFPSGTCSLPRFL